MARERDGQGGSTSESERAAGGKGVTAEPDAVRYAAAVEEIEQLLASIDRDDIDVDELATKVERAVQLLKVCRAKLKATEARVVEVLKDLDADDAAADAAADAAESAAEDAAPRKRKRKKGGGGAPSDGGEAPLPPPGPATGPAGAPDEELPF